MSPCAALPIEPHVGLKLAGAGTEPPQPHECARMYRTETDKFPKKVQDCPFTDRPALLAFYLTVLGTDVLAPAEVWPNCGAQPSVSR